MNRRDILQSIIASGAATAIAPHIAAATEKLSIRPTGRITATSVSEVGNGWFHVVMRGETDDGSVGLDFGKGMYVSPDNPLSIPFPERDGQEYEWSFSMKPSRPVDVNGNAVEPAEGGDDVLVSGVQFDAYPQTSYIPTTRIGGRG